MPTIICEYLNNIPFSDHGALLDPPTADLTARCLSMLAQLGEKPETVPAMARGIEWLRHDQHPEGSWYGRWGMNYIYGTWSVLCALNAAHVPHDAPEVRKASKWLISIQNLDGGWGEDGASYKLDYRGHEAAPSTASQTAWALLGLMAAGETDHPAVERGIIIFCAHKAATASGPSSFSPPPVSRACSICATTAIRNFSRSGRWRGIAI